MCKCALDTYSQCALNTQISALIGRISEQLASCLHVCCMNVRLIVVDCGWLTAVDSITMMEVGVRRQRLL